MQETIITATGQAVQVIDIDYEEVIKTDPETFHESKSDDTPLYPELPERANIGEIPEEDERLGMVDEADTIEIAV